MIAYQFIALWLAVCCYALWRGGGPERAVATMFLLAFPLSRLAGKARIEFAGIYIGVFAVDAILAIALTIIAFRANRHWTMAMAGLQLLQLASHVLKLADPAQSPVLYWIGRTVWAYAMLPILALGTIMQHMRAKSGDAVRSWLR